MAKTILAQELQALLENDATLALIDVRERNEYEQGQIFGATQIPRRSLESRVAIAVPVKDTRLILYDNDGYRSALAAATLEKYGYSNLHVLAGGLDAWKNAGFPVVKGVHVLSKAFGEIVAEVWNAVPKLSPGEVKAIIDAGKDDFVIIEVRPQDEVDKTGSLPGAIAIPGVELPLRAADYAKSGRKVITTCAGRTRGYIACATLKLMGLDNVYDLNNGTKGWRLAGFELQKDIPAGPPPSAAAREAADRFASRLLQEQGIQAVSVNELQALQQRSRRQTLYLVDVRTREEYEFVGHIPGSIWIPGGQAVQNSDDTVPVRNATLVFICDNGTRATITAYWYAKMGFSPYILAGGLEAWTEAGNRLQTGIRESLPLGFAEAEQRISRITASQLKQELEQRQSLTLIDSSDSKSFASGHIPGTRWIPRGWLEKRIPAAAPDKGNRLVVAGNDRFGPVLAAATLTDLGYTNVAALDGGTAAWKAAGYELDSGLADIEPDDWFIHLTEYSLEQSERYIKWEEELAYLPEYMAYFRRKGILKEGHTLRH